MEFNLKERTVLMVVAGSRAYGMDTAESDVDLLGICVPPSKFRDGFLHKFEQKDSNNGINIAQFYPWLNKKEQAKAAENDVEGKVYGIRKFFALAAQNNPNILDALFCRDEEVRHTTLVGDALRSRANEFISRKCRWTFGGFAKSQLKRINLHRGYLLNPPSHKPTREEFGLPQRTLIPANQLAAAEAEIRKKIDSWEVDYGTLDESEKIYIQDQMAKSWAEMKVGSDEKYVAAARGVGYDENFILLLDKERRYRAAMTKFRQYQDWKKNRNKERAAMESAFGFDGKHASHLARLYRMCKEILLEGKVNVYRDDAEELLAIRRGEWTYEQLMEFVENEEASINEAYEKSTLPRTPDYEALDDFCCELVRLMK